MLLFVLRDGRVALREVVRWEEWKPVFRSTPTKLSESIREQMKGTPWENAQESPTTKRSIRVAKVIRAETTSKSRPFEEKDQVQVQTKLRLGPSEAKDALVQFESVPAALKVWESLKAATSEPMMRRALRDLEKYLNKHWPTWTGAESPQNLQRFADGVCAAKGLHNYPRAKNDERPTSDDKRIVFIAKVLAGLRFNLSPTYASKKLSHSTKELSNCKDSATNPYKQFVQAIRSRNRRIAK